MPCCVGLTIIDQVIASIPADQQTLEVSVQLPATFLSERRSAVLVNDASMLGHGLLPYTTTEVSDKTRAFSRVEAHRDAISM
jgi:hypothetical protein